MSEEFMIGKQSAFPKTKAPIVDFRIVMFPRMMIHPDTKEMVMVPMQDFQYRREGSDEWFSTPGIEVEKHEPVGEPQ